MIAGSQTIADDRRRSQTIAEVCFHMIADDRRTYSANLRSAIRDRLQSYGNQPLVGGPSWCSRFMRRNRLSVRSRTTVGQKVPENWEEKVMNFP